MSGAVVYLLLFALVCGLRKKIRLCDCFMQGVQEGMHMAFHMLPPLLSMLLAIGALRVSGVTDALAHVCQPVLEKVGLSGEVLPLMLMRPLSGSASLAMVQELMTEYGPDSTAALVGCTLCASSETLFYVLSVYASASGIRKSRHIVPCGLVAWLTGSIVSGLIWKIWRF